MDTHDDKMEFNEKYDHKLIADHEYDNIKELDNPAPFWLMGLFYLTVIFSVIYGAYYFWLGIGDSQEAEYEKEVAMAELNKKAFDENKIALFADEVNLNEGANLFSTKTCITCHGQNGEGNTIGPNMTDEYWLNGNTPEELFQVVKYGNIQKGMTPFKGQLSDKQIVQVISYILLKLQGSNPSNAKKGEGEKLGLFALSTDEKFATNDSIVE